MTAAEFEQGVQFTVNQDGQVTAVVITPELWHHIVEALEDTQDQQLARTLAAKLHRGPVASGALQWQDVMDEWQ